jgi:hypothetical protein
MFGGAGLSVLALALVAWSAYRGTAVAVAHPARGPAACS